MTSMDWMRYLNDPGTLHLDDKKRFFKNCSQVPLIRIFKQNNFLQSCRENFFEAGKKIRHIWKLFQSIQGV